ncbi:MAG: bifunctional adenosylcobinamide kinase/adenosylcobinamide-phosphate guanylyltransferase [Pseudomonadota bacterium]
MRHLVLGGARSGKTRFAMATAEQLASTPGLIVTAEPRDGEMAERISRHQAERGAHWSVCEAPLSLAPALVDWVERYECVVVDCLSLWLSNCLEAGVWQHKRRDFIALLKDRCLEGKSLLLVSNEVGSGVVPLGELTRRYVDELGLLHQEIAAIVDEVTLVVAGLPQSLKRA